MQTVTIRAIKHTHWRGGHYVRRTDWQTLEVDDAALALLQADHDLEFKGGTVLPAQTGENTSPPAPLKLSDAEVQVLASLVEADFTKSNKPKTEVLTEKLGREVSATERDALWSAYQAQNTES